MKTDEKQLSGKKDVQETSPWTRVWKFIREELAGTRVTNGGWAHGAVTGFFSDFKELQTPLKTVLIFVYWEK